MDYLNWSNYGDVSISEGWKLLLSDADTNGEAFKGRYYLLDVYLHPDTDKFLVFDCYVDVTDTWIDKDNVMSYIGMTEETYDEVLYALGCYEYYGYMNFGAYAPREFDTQDDVLEFLKNFKMVNVKAI